MYIYKCDSRYQLKCEIQFNPDIYWWHKLFG